MKTIATILASVIGAVAGFIAGVALAFSFGLHEKAHVFGVALSAAAISALCGVSLVTRDLPTSRAGKSALVLFLLAVSTCFVIWLLHIIKVL